MKFIEKIIFITLLTLSIVYFGYKWLPTDMYNGNDVEKAILYPAISVYETGNLAFEGITSDEGDYDFVDTDEVAVSPKNGRQYSSQAPLSVLTAVPVYGLWKVIHLVFKTSPQFYPTVIYMRVVFAVIPFLLSVLFLFKILTRFLDEKQAWLALFLYIFGTMNLSFSFLNYSHILAELWVVLALYTILVKPKHFLSGLFCGLLLITDYGMIPLSFALLIFGMIYNRDKKGIKNAVIARLGFVPGLLIYLGYHYALFDNAFLPAVYYSTTADGGFLFPYRFSLTRLVQVLFGPSRGILFYTPTFIFAGIGTVRLFKEDKPTAILISGVTLLYLIGLAGYADYAGGWSPGIRFVIPLIPLWIIGFGHALQGMHHRKKIYRYLLYTALFVGVGLNLIPKMGHVFYPDLLTHPTYWSGARFIYGYYIDALSWGDRLTFLKAVVYVILISAVFFLIFRSRAEIEPRREGWISAGIALIITALIVIFPHRIHTSGMQDLYRLSQQFPHIGWFQVQAYSGNEAEIRTEFAKNQEPAEYLLHHIYAYNIAQSSYRLTETYIDWTETELYDEIMYNNALNKSEYEQALNFYKAIQKRLYKYLIFEKNDQDPDEVTYSKWGARYDNYQIWVQLETNTLKLREMYEYLYYGAMMEYDWTNIRGYLSNYIELYES